MALFGLIGRTSDLAYAYRGREPASQKAARKRAGKEEAASAARRAGHRRSIAGAERAARQWEKSDRKKFGA